MDRKKIIQNKEEELYLGLETIHTLLSKEFRNQFERSLPFADELFDRWERAKNLNFGKNTSIYDSSYVFGNPKIGNDVWIGPFTIIDGSGELTIGNNVTISSGVHIYTHDNIKQTLIGKSAKIERGKVSIGNNTYIGPNAIISSEIEIGSYCVIGANSFVKSSFENNSIIAGTPAKKIGDVIILNNQIEFKYLEK